MKTKTTKRDMRPLRQGDVLLIPVEKLPVNLTAAKKEPRLILQYGEVTGHAHAISPDQADAFVETKESMTVVDALTQGARAFLEVCYKAELKHEEHGTIDIAPGAYEIRRQREYSPEAIKFVVD